MIRLHYALVAAACVLAAACSTPIDIRPPAPAPSAPPPPTATVDESKVAPKQRFVCPRIGNASTATAPDIRRDVSFYEFRNLRFETLTLVRKGMISSATDYGMTSSQLDQLFYAITGTIADEWRQRLAWVSPPGKSGRTISADLWLADLPPAGSSDTLPKLSLTLRDNASGELLLVQCGVRTASGPGDDVMTNAIQSWASALASHMEAASH